MSLGFYPGSFFVLLLVFYKNTKMTFINEYISEQSLKKYEMDPLDKRTKYGSIASDFWVIDKENHTWLRKLHVESDHTKPDGGYTGISYWEFYWRRHLITVKIKWLESGGERWEYCWERKKLLDISLPTVQEDKRDIVLKELELALTAYKDNGVLSKSINYELKFEL